MKLSNIRAGSLRIDGLEFRAGEHWCVIGGNGSGKSILAGVLVGDVALDTGAIEHRFNRVSRVSLESAQSRYEKELANDDTDFLDRIDYGATGRALLLESGCSEGEAVSASRRFGIEGLLDRGCRQFSSGEMRKILLLQETLRRDGLLILDEPFESLDVESRGTLSALIRELAESGRAILLLVNRVEDIGDWITHVALIEKGVAIASGERSEILNTPEFRQFWNLKRSPARQLPRGIDDSGFSESRLLALHRGAVRYGAVTQFEGFDWELRRGEHTLVSGPNGCGKSTLLGLIFGDHPQCYSNDLEVLGYKRGSGESIWDVKKRIGFVSSSLHRDYRVSSTALLTVVSGFYDTIGIYKKPAMEELRLAGEWLDAISMGDVAEQPFNRLSYGQQRLALIARSLVKRPPLLILDEPTQGLDDLNARLVLSVIERIADSNQTTILFVSHREDEHLELFRKRLRFFRSSKKGVRFDISVESD